MGMRFLAAFFSQRNGGGADVFGCEALETRTSLYCDSLIGDSELAREE